MSIYCVYSYLEDTMPDYINALDKNHLPLRVRAER